MYLRELLKLFIPDHVVVVLFLGNDVSDDLFYEKFLANKDRAQFVDNTEIRWPWSFRNEILSQRSAESAARSKVEQPFYKLVFQNSRKIIGQLEISRLVSKAIKNSSVEQSELKLKEEIKNIANEYRSDIRLNNELIFRDDIDPETREKLWSPTEAALSKMIAICGELEIGISLFLLPSNFDKNKRGTDPEQRLAKFAREHGVVLSDLSSVLASYDRSELLFEVDGHFNEGGNVILAETLFKELKKIGVLEK